MNPSLRCLVYGGPSYDEIADMKEEGMIAREHQAWVRAQHLRELDKRVRDRLVNTDAATNSYFYIDTDTSSSTNS